jgi:hypothetical protein
MKKVLTSKETYLTLMMKRGFFYFICNAASTDIGRFFESGDYYLESESGDGIFESEGSEEQSADIFNPNRKRKEIKEYIDSINEEVLSVALDSNIPSEELWRMKCGEYYTMLKIIIKRNKVPK